MIILDTNVVSEPMKPNGSMRVQAWLDSQNAGTLYLTAISLSELLVGVELLPDGKRKTLLNSALLTNIERLFGTRILPFGRQAAIEYARLLARARSNGVQLSVADAQIAAIATAQRCSVATRDVGPFRAAGVSVVNPWEV